MADVRIKDLAAGSFAAGEKIALDSTGTGTRQIDLSDVVAGVLGDIRNLPGGAAVAGEKLVTDSAGNGTRQIDIQALYNAIAVINGLTNNAGVLELGGALSKSTVIGGVGSGFDLTQRAEDIRLEADAVGRIQSGGTASVESAAGTTISATGGDTVVSAAVGDVNVSSNAALRLSSGTAGTPAVGDHLIASAADGTVAWQSPAYGELFTAPGDPGTPFLVTTSGTPVQITGLTTGLISGSPTLTAASSRFVVGANGGGVYRVSAYITFDGSANTTARFGFIKNASGVFEGSLRISRKLGTGGDVGAGAASGLISLAAGDTLEVAFDSATNGNTYNVWYLNASISREA